MNNALGNERHTKGMEFRKRAFQFPLTRFRKGFRAYEKKKGIKYPFRM